MWLGQKSPVSVLREGRVQPQTTVARPDLVLCEGHWQVGGVQRREAAGTGGEEEQLTGLQVADPRDACQRAGEPCMWPTRGAGLGQVANSWRL